MREMLFVKVLAMTMRRHANLTIPSLLVVTIAMGAALYSLAHESSALAGTKDAAKIQTLRIAREKYLNQFGPGHPTVKGIDAQIKALGGQAARMPADKLLALKPKLRKMSDQDLRDAVGLLIDRVVALETEVEELRRAEPRVELLKRSH